MAAETVDTLELSIRTNATEAAEQISRLSTSVSNFGKDIKSYIGSIEGLAAALERIVSAASGLSGIKDIKNIVSGASKAVSTAKDKAVGSATRALNVSGAGNGARLINGASSKVGARSRYVQWGDGSTRKFDKSADEIARGLNNGLHGTSYTNKELSAKVADIRQKIIKEDYSAVQDIMKLSDELASEAGMKNVHPLIAELNARKAVAGGKFIGVDDKDVAGLGETIGSVNSILGNMGARFKLKKWPAAGSAKRVGMSGMDELLDGQYANIEDFFYAVSHSQWTGHSAELGNWHANSDSELAARIMDALSEDIYRSQIVENEKAPAADAREAIREIKDVAQEASEAVAYQNRPGIRGFDEYAGKDWRRENAEDTAYFDRRLGEILEPDGAEKNLYKNIKAMRVGDAGSATPSDRGMGRIAEEASSAKTEVEGLNEAARVTAEEFMQSESAADRMQMRLDGVKDKLEEALNSDDYNPEKIARLSDEYEKLKNKIEEAGEAASDAGGSIGGLRGALSAVGDAISGSRIGKLGTQLMRMTRMRAMRYVIRAAASGLKEGVTNLYQWSKASNGPFAGAMDTIATKAMLAKNSIATAFAPAIQALVPVLNTVVSWVNAASNAIAQFLALLGGKTSWTKATESAQDWAAATKSGASGASDAMKDLLADWDELNVIQSESTGGGGGGSGSKAVDYSNMFEETSKFDEWTKYFNDIKDITIGIGEAILGWKVSTAFGGALGTLGSILSTGAIVYVTAKVTELFDKKYLDTGEEGWLVADVVASAVGSALAGKVASNIVGVKGGVIAVGLTMDMSAGVSYGIALAHGATDKANALRRLSIIKGLIGTAITASGFAIAAGPAGIALGLVASAAMFTVAASISTVIEQTKTAKEIAEEVFARTGDGGISVDDIFKEVQTKFDEASSGYSIVIDAFSGAPKLKSDLESAYSEVTKFGDLVKGGGPFTAEEAERFKQNWANVFSAFESITRTNFDTIFAGLTQSLTSANEEIREQAKELRLSTLMLQENLSHADAEFKAGMEETIDRISHGKASNEDIEKYTNYMNAMAELSGANSYKALNDAIALGGEAIDFQNVENLREYLANVKEEAEKAREAVEEGYNAELEAIDSEIKQTKLRKEIGAITEEEYNSAMAVFEQLKGNSEKARESAKSEIDSVANEAYKQVLEQAYSGLDELMNNDTPDLIAAWEYMFSVIEPIVEVLNDLNLPIDDGLKNAFGVGDGKGIIGALEAFAPDADVNPIFSFLKERYQDAFTENPAKIPAEVDSESVKENLIEPMQEELNEAGFECEVEVKPKENFSEQDGFWGWNLGGHRPYGVIGAAGASDVGLGRRSTSWYTEPTKPIQVNADASGMALDSTVGTAGTQVTAKIGTLEGLIDRANRLLVSIEGYARTTANKDLTVNINPSTGFAQTMNRSSGRYSKVVGGPDS